MHVPWAGLGHCGVVSEGDILCSTDSQCQIPACSNCKNLKYSSLYFEKVQRPWSKVPKGVSIRQIISKSLIPEND